MWPAVEAIEKLMTAAFAIVLVLHGLIHFLGFAKAFGLADLPQLTQPISPFLGALWLIAGLLFLAAAVSLFEWPRWWWAIGACAIVVSTFVIVPSWSDAKFGAVGNLIALAGVALSFLGQGPVSLRAAYDRDVARVISAAAQTSPDGTSAKNVRWSTPLGAYRSFQGVRLASGGEAKWYESNREYTYIELTFDDVRYNVRSR